MTVTPAILSVFDALSSVLFVSVSVVARATIVSVADGRVSVPVAAAADWTFVPPDVPPAKVTDPAADPATPTTRADPEMVRLALSLTAVAPV